MLNRCGVAALVGLLPLQASSQLVCSLGPNAASYKPSADERPSPDAMQLVARVNAAAKTICKSNCPGVAVLRNATAANAMLVAEGNQPKLVYAPQFLAAVDAGFGDAGVMGIVAHELGHAMDDAMGGQWIKSNWSAELRADSWAGCTLARSNLTQADNQGALGALEKYAPAGAGMWVARLAAIRAGYTACGGDSAKFDKRK